MRSYFDFVTGNAKHPDSRSIRAYIDAMKNHKVGDKKVLGALATLNSLHRNPVIHPDQQLDSAEEAQSLLGSVQAAMQYMLSELPPAPLVLERPEGVA